MNMAYLPNMESHFIGLEIRFLFLTMSFSVRQYSTEEKGSTGTRNHVTFICLRCHTWRWQEVLWFTGEPSLTPRGFFVLRWEMSYRAPSHLCRPGKGGLGIQHTYYSKDTGILWKITYSFYRLNKFNFTQLRNFLLTLHCFTQVLMLTPGLLYLVWRCMCVCMCVECVVWTEIIIKGQHFEELTWRRLERSTRN